MKQDVGEGGEGVEYLNCWTIEATWELQHYSLVVKLEAVKHIDLFSSVSPFIVNNLQNYYCTAQHARHKI